MQYVFDRSTGAVAPFDDSAATDGRARTTPAATAVPASPINETE
jgi:hypothetical protein